MSKQLKLPTLLVVADNPSIRFWVKKHLDERFFILSAETEQQALQALNARLDFIIVDSEIEACDALDLCKSLSQMIQKNLVPILLITGRLKKSYRDQAIQSGVTDFLSNQLDSEELEARITAGTKAASARQKTEEVGLSFKIPVHTSNSNYLKNKFLLNDQALRLLTAAKEEQTPVALLLMRIDGFAQMENQPEVVTLFSDFVNGFLREKDLLIPASEGGFILLLSNTTTANSRLVAEKLRGNIQKHPFRTKNGMLNLTVSIVISSLAASAQGFNKMIDSASKSLKAHSETNLIISIDPEDT